MGEVGKHLEIEALGDFRAEVQPEVRYAKLKKDIEKGFAKDETWAAYCEVCLETDRLGEAAKALRHISSPELAIDLTRKLEKRGVHFLLERKEGPPGRPAAPPSRKRGGAPAPRGSSGMGRPASPEPQRRNRTRISSALQRARRIQSRRREVARESAAARILDGVHYLFVEHMPFASVCLILSFPFAAALSFYHPAPGMPLLDEMLRALPTLIALGMSLHCMRRVLQASSEGMEDAPVLTRDFTDGTWKALLGFSTLLSFAGVPAVLAALAGFAPGVWITLAALGVAWLPMATGGLVVGRTFDAVIPTRIFAAYRAAPGGSLLLAFGTALSLLPVAFVFLLLGNAPILLRIGMAGPFFVLQGMILSRMLGRLFYAHRPALIRALALPVEAPPRVEVAGRGTSARRRSAPAESATGNLPGWDRKARPPRGQAPSRGRKIETNRPGKGRGSGVWKNRGPTRLGSHTHTPLRRR